MCHQECGPHALMRRSLAVLGPQDDCVLNSFSWYRYRLKVVNYFSSVIGSGADFVPGRAKGIIELEHS